MVLDLALEGHMQKAVQLQSQMLSAVVEGRWRGVRAAELGGSVHAVSGMLPGARGV